MKSVEALLPGVPKIESPFFDTLFEGADAETLRVARELNTRGYAVIDFPDAEIDAMSHRIKADLRERYDWASWWRAPQRGLRIQDAWSFQPDVRRIAVNQEIRALLGRLYGREAFPFQTLNFPVGTQQHFHSDSIHFSSMPERFMCGVWLAFEDVGLDQGPLIYYPGSHRWPIYSNEHVGHTAALTAGNSQQRYEPLWRALVEQSGITPERFEAKAGQALIWAANLLHGGDAHIDLNKTRWSQVTHYYFEGCAYYTPMWSDPPLGAVRFREPVSIVDGRPRKNIYNGAAVPRVFVENASGPATRVAMGAESEVFDPVAYLQANPDVAAAGVDPTEHWTLYGHKEGRFLRR